MTGLKAAGQRYLYDLLHLKKWFPRRQEAELCNETCLVKGEEKSALVTHAEIQQWGLGLIDAMVISVSHPWESREHPDPLRFQLQNLVNAVSLYDAAYFSELWIFLDYVSLYQWRRNPKEERSYQKSMTNVQVLYAHSSTLTFRMEHVTPDDVWTKALKDEEYRIPVYDGDSRQIKLLPLKDLVHNRNSYHERGWCQGEKEWAAARSVPAQNLVIDGEENEEEKTKKIPTDPDVFIHQISTAKFTWANDRASVVDLQRKIFKEKVTNRKWLHLTDLTERDVVELTSALPYYRQLKDLEIKGFTIADTAEVIALIQARGKFCC